MNTSFLRHMPIIYQLNDQFYEYGMNQPNIKDTDAWWNIGYI